MSYQGIETSHFKLVQFLLLYHVISNVHICSFTCIIFHVHGGASKMVLHAQNLVHKKKNYEGQCTQFGNYAEKKIFLPKY